MRKSAVSAQKILVVEDEPGIGEVCLRVLTDAGFEVDLAVNGMVAEDKLWGKAYDVVIIDIRTPLRDGKQLFQCISERYPRLEKGVIFTTGDVMGGDTQYFLEKCGRPFLLKPFTPAELKSVVSETLGSLS